MISLPGIYVCEQVPGRDQPLNECAIDPGAIMERMGSKTRNTGSLCSSKAVMVGR